ncbi:uncharacterized protein [Aristolochia californica]|uniref:uncharacterized protein n=1 Tax=Aristolochia californica TaxID=171875 RepID=UPI0035E00ABF
MTGWLKEISRDEASEFFLLYPIWQITFHGFCLQQKFPRKSVLPTLDEDIFVNLMHSLRLPRTGPNLGYLVIADEEWEVEARDCWGLCKDNRIREFPFPSNKILTVTYTEHHGESSTTHRDKVLFVPVIGQPLSANQYYVIRAQGKYKGEMFPLTLDAYHFNGQTDLGINPCCRKACTYSWEEDMGTCCFCNYIKDTKAQFLDLTNIYQQVQIERCRSARFIGSSIAADGFPPRFLRRRGWRAYTSSSLQIPLEPVNGVDVALPNGHPNFDFPISSKCSKSVTKGRWYCPFMFIKEDETAPILEDKSGAVLGTVNTSLQREVVRLCGEEEVMAQDISVGDGWVWFMLKCIAFRTQNSGVESVGLTLPVLERMRWEAKRGGWVEREEREERIKRVVEFKGKGGWSTYGLYVSVERFVLKRLDGNLVLTHDFRHTREFESKWE